MKEKLLNFFTFGSSIMSRSFSAMVNSCMKAIEERITVFRNNPKTQPESKLCLYTAWIYKFPKRSSNGSLGINEISCYNHIFEGNKILDSYWKRSGPRNHRYPSLHCCWMSIGTLRLATTDYRRLDGRLLGMGGDKGFSPEPPSWL